ncbi:hypothetical protein [Clostridium sp. LP20]|uniref:hypothetical protein n=1 Tax=Clostridium sp. LP20 TaxID=3418665 RepID=UPI003EE6754D
MLFSPISVQANTVKSNGIHSDILNTFPNIKESIEADGYNEIVSIEEQDLKFTLKDSGEINKKSNYVVDDYLVEEVTDKEFNGAKIKKDIEKQRNLLKVGLERNYEGDDFEWNTGGDSYLALTTVAYRNSADKFKFKVIYDYNWINRQMVTLQDAIGISIGESMKIYQNSYESKSAHTAMVVDPTSPTGVSYVT